MIPGYDFPRPEKMHYDAFVEELVHGLNNLGEKRLSLMLYGSYPSGRYQAGRSDIDAVLLVPGDVVTDKRFLDGASVVLQSVQRQNHVPFQVAVSDWTLFGDGRFSPYLADFTPFFALEGKVLLGEDPRPYLTRETTRDGIFHTMSFNLRKARVGILLGEYLLENDYPKYIKTFHGVLDATARAATKILHVRDGQPRPEKRGAKAICEVYPEVDGRVFDEIQFLYTDLSRLDHIYKDRSRMQDMMTRATTTFETMIRGYRKEYPEK